MCMRTRGHYTMVTETSKTTNFRARFFYNMFLNQARADQRLAHTWLLETGKSVCVHVCVSAPGY